MTTDEFGRTTPYDLPGPSRFAIETLCRARLLALMDTDGADAIWNALTEATEQEQPHD